MNTDRMLQRNKPYKAVLPSSTVSKIRQILESIDIFTFENNREDYGLQLYSSRLLINNLDSFGIGVSGKGMKRDYALASAYGEFMERLQNGIMLNKKTIFSNIDDLAKKEFVNIIGNSQFFNDSKIMSQNCEIRLQIPI